ncbi:unnamed protein product [Adineta steineri]|uniref:Uncharacterized protein n=1 Tax=Adineta steineri TaxID=433720 RepID=A0A814PQ65_9BILA|nr:unnamed protein product [Adineta steineri]CAF4258696.1 unnamed protein product [Adineta steineri]
MTSTNVGKNNQENMTVTGDQQSKTAPIHDATSFHEHSHECNDPSHNHDTPSFFDQNDFNSMLAGAQKDISTKRKHKKPQQQNIIRAELIPGHRGEQNIDDLVHFINSPSPPKNDKKQKKKSTTTTTS